MINDMNEDFLIRLNYVETSEPDRVAKELQQQDQRIAELEKENEELKEEGLKLRKLLDINDIFDYNSMLDLLNDMNCKCWNDYREKIYNLEQENAELKQQLENVEDELDFCHTKDIHRRRLYNIWKKLNNRCLNKTDKAYKNYGGRGVTICKDWQKIEGFYMFLIWSLKNGYSKKLTIDRIDNNGNYEPNNCRWVSRLVQNNNSRKNRVETAFGITDTLANLCRKHKVSYDTVWFRLKSGLSIEESLTKPIRKGNYKRRFATEQEARERLEGKK